MLTHVYERTRWLIAMSFFLKTSKKLGAAAAVLSSLACNAQPSSNAKGTSSLFNGF